MSELLAAMRRDSLVQSPFRFGRSSEQVLPPMVVRRAAPKRQILEVLRGRRWGSPNAAIMAAEPDHSEISVSRRSGSDGQR